VQQSPPNPAVIGLDESSEHFAMYYFDSRGVTRRYEMDVSDGVWRIWRDAPAFSQRFTATFGDDGNAITGNWELSTDGTRWEHDLALTYTRAR
jgi:hypothetical protein